MTTADAVRVLAPAKINLFLHVGDRRDDGYHALQSLVVFAEVGDELALFAADELSLSISGPFGGSLGAGPDNLVLRAARLLAKPARMVLNKNLPVASGIGGGSADAAAALRGLDQLHGLGRRDLAALAASLGSDVPVCVASRPAWMAGRGEILDPVAGVPPMPMLLVNPGIAVATADVFRTLTARRGTGLPRVDSFRNTEELLALLRTTVNDLEAPAVALQPVIAEVLEELAGQPGRLLARMSGSGATCFALFDEAGQAELAARVITARHPAWWVRATRIFQ